MRQNQKDATSKDTDIVVNNKVGALEKKVIEDTAIEEKSDGINKEIICKEQNTH